MKCLHVVGALWDGLLGMNLADWVLLNDDLVAGLVVLVLGESLELLEDPGDALNHGRVDDDEVIDVTGGILALAEGGIIKSATGLVVDEHALNDLGGLPLVLAVSLIILDLCLLASVLVLHDGDVGTVSVTKGGPVVLEGGGLGCDEISLGAGLLLVVVTVLISSSEELVLGNGKVSEEVAVADKLEVVVESVGEVRLNVWVHIVGGLRDALISLWGIEV